MAHTSDLVAAVVAAHGTRLLRARSGPRFEAASELLRIGLSEDRPGWAFLRFMPGDLALDLWMDELRASGAEAVLLVDVEAARRAPPPGVPAAALHAFSGSSTLGPGVQRAGQIEPYAPAVLYPPQSLVGFEDLLDFIGRNPKRAKMREMLLWQDKHNIKLTDGANWDAFVTAVTPERLRDVLRFWRMVLSNVEWKDGEPQAWFKIEKSRPNPRPEPRFEFRRTNAIAAPSAKPDLAKRREDLRGALTAIRDYAAKEKMAPWDRNFEACLQTLDAAPDASNGIAAIFEDALSRESLALLLATMQSDVFGGMGSWNDTCGSNEEEYREVSDRLYRLLAPCWMDAVNASLER